MDTLIKYKKYLLIFFIVGFLIYFPILTNGFVWDDNDYIINNPEVHQLDIPRLLGPNEFNSGPFYRPIPALYFASAYSLFNTQAFYYHFLQLTLHILDTFLLLIFLTIFFDTGIAFFLSLLFLIHPINLESVAFIGSTTSELYFFFGMTAFLLASQKNMSFKKIFISGILFLLAILTKETGALFLLLLIAYRYLFKLEKIKQFLGIGSLIAAIYFLFRYFVGEVAYSMLGLVRIATLTLSERILNIPAIIFYYLKTFILPLQLLIWQQWVIIELNPKTFYIPLLIITIFLVGILITAFFLYKKDNEMTIKLANTTSHKKKFLLEEPKKLPAFLFFTLWFFLGMGLLLQIVPLDMIVADRWFYFPIVGLLGIIGIGLQFLQKSYHRFKTHYYTLAIILLCLLSLRTFTRTFDWKDNATLYSHDLRANNGNYILLNAYAREVLFPQNKIDEALKFEKKSVGIYPTVSSLNELGTAYQIKKQYNEAIDAYTRSINLSKSKHFNYTKAFAPYANIASILILEKKPLEATSFIEEQGLKDNPENPQLYMLLAFAQSAANNQPKALEAASKAHTLSPDDQQISQIYMQLKNNIPIVWSPY